METFILPAILILFLSSSALAVTVSTRNPRVEVHENSDAVFSCEMKTEKDDTPRIEWKKRSKEVSLIYYDQEFKGDFLGRAEIRGATVTLHKVTYKDAGVYHCEVTAPLDKVKFGEINVTLRVLGGTCVANLRPEPFISDLQHIPDLMILTAPKTVAPATPDCNIPSSVLSGTKVDLLCKDKHSVPPATYKWYKDSKLLNPSGLPNITYTIDAHTGILRFKTVSHANSGRYHCEASNGVGKPKSCDGKQMDIHDVKMMIVMAAAVGAFLLLCLCGLGVCCARRKGHCTKDQGENRNLECSQTPQDAQHFRHTRSFIL